jgi:hypothetical protein
VKHKSTASFWKHYGALPKAIQMLADKNFELLKLDPYHPSLHFKNVSSELWSARVGMHFRALALPATGATPSRRIKERHAGEPNVSGKEALNTLPSC